MLHTIANNPTRQQKAQIHVISAAGTCDDGNITVVADGGASGSRFAILDKDGKRLAESEAGPASLSLGVNNTCDAILEGVGKLARHYGKAADWLPQHVMLGLAGSEQVERREEMQRSLATHFTCDVVTDGIAHLNGVTLGSAGICLSLGTGSVVHWQDGKGKNGFAGGWGFQVGDEASGAWLGRALVNAWLWAIDQNMSCGTIAASVGKSAASASTDQQYFYSDNSNFPLPSADIVASLEKKIGNHRSDIQQWTLAATATDYASLVNILMEGLERKEKFVKILQAAGTQQCLRMIMLCPHDLPVYLSGGLLPFYAEELVNQLSGRVRDAKGDAIDGLFLLAQKQSGKN